MKFTTVKKAILCATTFVALAGESAAIAQVSTEEARHTYLSAAAEPCRSSGELETSSMYMQVDGATRASFPLRGGDPVGPFPLATLVRFPWATIDGVWTMKSKGATIYFSFEVQNACDGRPVIRVRSFDPTTFKVTAEGLGLGSENDTTVRAIMASESSTPFMIYIRQFEQHQTRTKTKLSTVVTIRPYDAEDKHLIATKQSTLSLEKFVEKQARAQAARREAARRRVAAGRP